MEITLPASALPQTPIGQQAPVGFSLRNQNVLVQDGNTQNCDFMSLIFQQLGLDSNANPNLKILAEQTKDNQMLELLKKQLDENGTELSMQMAAELLNSVGINPLIIQQAINPASAEQNLELLKIASGSKESSPLVLQNNIIPEINSEIIPENQNVNSKKADTNSVISSETAEFAAKMDNVQNKTDFSVSVQNSEITEINASDKPVKALKLETNFVKTEKNNETDAEISENPKKEILTTQSQFEKDVKSALKSVKSDSNTKKEDIDIEKMQKDVKTGVYLNTHELTSNSMKMSSSEKIETQQIDVPLNFIKQVETGIKSGLQTGKNEFTFKLKPEGLGEITVKMVEESGRIALNIIASTTRVEKLLNGELASLQQSLRQYNVEVQPAITETSSASSYSAFSYSHNFSQQNSQHQFQNQERLSWQNSRQNENVQDNELQEILTSMKTPQKNSALDTYI